MHTAAHSKSQRCINFVGQQSPDFETPQYMHKKPSQSYKKWVYNYFKLSEKLYSYTVLFSDCTFFKKP